MSSPSRFRLWPRSLYGQILLVAALALLVAQGINAALLLAGARNRAVTEISTMIVSRVANQIERQEAIGTPIGEADWWNRAQVEMDRSDEGADPLQSPLPSMRHRS